MRQPTTGVPALTAGGMMLRMAKQTYVANVTLFDGRTVKKRQGILFGTDGIEWVGAHARAPKGASAAREVAGAGKTARAIAEILGSDMATGGPV